MCISYTIYINFLYCKIFFSKIFITTTFSKNPGIKPGMGIIFYDFFFLKRKINLSCYSFPRFKTNIVYQLLHEKKLVL
jgi:hypothetical protein